MPAAIAAAACPTTPHPPPPPYPTSPKKRRFGTPRLRAMTFSEVGWMLHFVMPSMSDGTRPASSSASLAASSAVTSSGRLMFLENGSWPMPTMAALSLSDTGPCLLPCLALPLGALAGVVLDRLADRLEGAAHERGTVLCRPVAARGEPGERPLELRHDVAGEELVGEERRLAVGPLVPHEEVRPEAARLVPQAFDLRPSLARCPDDGEAASVERVHHLGDVLDLADERQGRDALEIVDPGGEPERDVAPGLVHRRGEMHGPDEAPLLAAHRLPVLGRHVVGDRPGVAKGVEAARGGGADREKPEPVLPCRPRARGRHDRGHGHLHVRARVGPELQARVAEREP